MINIDRHEDDDPTYAAPYDPASRERHEWEELFAGIPMAATSQHTADGPVWSLAGGTLYLPQTAARIAQHAELVGMVYDPDRAQIRRARLATGVHVWVDRTVTLPGEQGRVDATAAALAEAMPADERRELAAKLLALDEEDTNG